jgi:hypothetical protein
VLAWWTRHPQANIGLATGQCFDVLDVDGPAGAHAIQELAATHGLRSAGPLVRTGGGGWHFYLAPTGLGSVRPSDLEHVDWRGRGGYVVAPPSRHASGRSYQWVAGRDLDTPPGQVPAVLLKRLQPRHLQRPIDPVQLAASDRSSERYARAALTEELARVAAAPVGHRNRQLWESTSNLYNLVATGALDHREVDAGLLAAAERCGLLAETALIGVADSNQPAAVLALDQLQGRTPIVWTITALVAVLSLAIQRTGLVWRWLSAAGMAAAVIFLLGSVFSVLGRTPEQNSSLVGIGLFIVWMLLLSIGLWCGVTSSTPTGL